jgi:hypothetical protein
MKRIKLLALIVVVAFGCKEHKNDTDHDEANGNDLGRYEAVFIDVKNTLIPEDIDPNVLKEERLLKNVNLVNTDQFWGTKKDFSLFAMGSLEIPETKIYYFKLTSAGKIVFKLNNKDLVKNEAVHSTESNLGEMYLEKGAIIFEYEYYPAFKDPYLVLEWSENGQTYEVVPDTAFNNLDAFSVDNWMGNEVESDSIQDNVLSEIEKKDGWELLFDGKTTNGWHTYNKPGMIGSKWKAKDGMLVFEGRNRFEFFVAGRKIELGPTNKVLDGGEDIVSDRSFENFELTLEWWISEAGNNGILYTVQEDEIYDEVWKTSPEMQIMDNQKHKDGLIVKHRAGDLYDLIGSDPVRVKPQGEWNKVRIIKNKGEIEHWLNGGKVLAYDLNSNAWKDLISKSKFKDLTEFASSGPGQIGFQDHDNEVHFKNIKIKELD